MDKYKYVVGFAFTIDTSSVLLIRKNRPRWQAGCLNGIGGKIENGETPLEAMKREAFEEAGINIEWLHRGVMKGINDDGSTFECHIFYAYADFEYQQKEDEELKMYNSMSFCDYGPVINNLKYLIPFGIYMDRVSFLTLDYSQPEEEIKNINLSTKDPYKLNNKDIIRRNMTNKEYFNEFLHSIKEIYVKWNFDEAQADPFHNQFDSDEFIRRLKEIIYK